MDLLGALQSFVRVVDTGSFSAVARQERTSQSTVTRQISQLEDHFGVRLLHRTTRRLSLTHDGQDLLVHARQLRWGSNAARRWGMSGLAPPWRSGCSWHRA